MVKSAVSQPLTQTYAHASIRKHTRTHARTHTRAHAASARERTLARAHASTRAREHTHLKGQLLRTCRKHCDFGWPTVGGTYRTPRARSPTAEGTVRLPRRMSHSHTRASPRTASCRMPGQGRRESLVRSGLSRCRRWRRSTLLVHRRVRYRCCCGRYSSRDKRPTILPSPHRRNRT